MSDIERDSQLSAMLDDELPRSQCELLERRLCRDAKLKHQWISYSLIGAVIRNEPIVSMGFAHAVVAAIAENTTTQNLLPQPLSNSLPLPWIARKHWALPFGSVAVAASVVVLAIFYFNFSPSDKISQNSIDTVALSEVVIPEAGMSEGSIGTAENLLSYVAPVQGVSSNNSSLNSLASNVQMVNFIVAHSEFSAPLSRQNVLSYLTSFDRLVEVPEGISR